jgi:hypothetical protein
MANTLPHSKTLTATYLAGYLALLLLAISSIILQGGNWIFIGSGMWICSAAAVSFVFVRKFRCIGQKTGGESRARL